MASYGEYREDAGYDDGYANEGARAVEDIILRIREACLARGAAGLKGLGRWARIMDDDNSGCLSVPELSKGLRDYGVPISQEEVEILARYFDTNGDGTINFDELIMHLRPPMNETRTRLVNKAFDLLDSDGSGVITIEDLAAFYDPRHHPKYQSGEWDAEKVFLQYLKSFDSPADPDSQVTREEFINYYSGVSASIDLDTYFDLLMRRAFPSAY